MSIVQQAKPYGQQVEKALVDYFLKTSGAYGDSSLICIDVLDTSLQEALKDFLLDGKTVKHVLKEATQPVENIRRLFSGVLNLPITGSTLPNFFRYLVLVCYVVATEGEADNNFRHNLAVFYGSSENTFNQLEGLPSLWKKLEQWMFVNKENLGLRNFKIPQNIPSKKKYVGHVYALAFPTWRDRNRLERSFREERITTPQELFKIIKKSNINNKRSDFSDAFGAALDRFNARYEKNVNSPMLYEDPFWKVVENIKDIVRANKTGMVNAYLELCLDDFDLNDSQILFYNESIEPAASYDIIDGLERGVDFFAKYTNSVLTAKCFQFKIIPFCFSEMGLMREQIVRPEKTIDKGAVIFNSSWYKLSFIPIKKVHELNKNYSIALNLTSIELNQVYEFLESLAWYKQENKKRERLSAIDVLQGIRNHNKFLYRPNLPILLKANIDGHLSVKSKNTVLIEQVVSDQQKLIIPFHSEISGDFRIQLTEKSDEKLSQIKNITLSHQAPEHVFIRQHKSNDWREIVEFKNNNKAASELGRRLPLLQSKSQPGELDARFEDLLEAIYFQGKSGWAEFELIPLIKNVLQLDYLHAWDVLRVLQESDWMYVTQAYRFRARLWWLKEPKLIQICPDTVVLNGSAPLSIRNRFCNTVRSLGGEYHQIAGMGDLSPCTEIATLVDVHALSNALGWPIVQHDNDFAGVEAPQCWPVVESEYLSFYGKNASLIWDWEKGHFTSHIRQSLSCSEYEIQIHCFRRAKNDRGDLYVVFRQDDKHLVTDSRIAAIIEGYRIANKAMFRVSYDQIIRLTLSDHLPYLASRFLWQRSLVNSGLVQEDGVWSYRYAASKNAIADLEKIFGREMFGLTEQRNSLHSTWNALSRHRLHARYLIRID